MSADLLFYQFSRLKIEECDFAHFISLYTPNQLPVGVQLKAMMGRMVFCVEGYDADSREVYTIPEVRRFYAAFHRAWPYWLFFCDLRSAVLSTMVICCLESFTALKVDGRPNCRVEYDPLELVHFIARDIPDLNDMCERAGMSEDEICNRTRDVFHYFHLPFDV